MNQFSLRRCMITALVCMLLPLALWTSPLRGDDWPQFLGANRNGMSSEKSLLDAFPNSGPALRWRVPGGVGMSAIAVQGEFALTTWNADNKQLLVALDTLTGNVKWKVEMGKAFKNAMGDGPRATPCIVGQNVYAYSGEGILVAAELQSGKVLWRKNLTEAFSTEPSEYGMSSSPLVVDGRVIVHVGGAQGAVVALATDDGKVLWKAGSGHAGYSSPTLLDIQGTQQVVSITGTAVMGIEPANGQVLWSYPVRSP